MLSPRGGEPAELARLSRGPCSSCDRVGSGVRIRLPKEGGSAPDMRLRDGAKDVLGCAAFENGSGPGYCEGGYPGSRVDGAGFPSIEEMDMLLPGRCSGGGKVGKSLLAVREDIGAPKEGGGPLGNGGGNAC